MQVWQMVSSLNHIGYCTYMHTLLAKLTVSLSFQAENIYNDEEPEAQPSELERDA